MEQSSKRGLGFWAKRRSAVGLMAIVGIMALIPSVALAWVSWDGIDPVIDLGNGHKMSITLVLQKWLGCEIDEPVDVRVELPKSYKNAKVVQESSYTYGDKCPGHQVTTETDLVIGGNGDKAHLKVSYDADVDEDDRPRGAKAPYVEVRIDGDLVATLKGSLGNETIRGVAPLP